MKKLSIALTIIILTAIYSCKKSEVVFTPTANLLVANAVVGGGTLTLNQTTQTVSNNNSTNFPLFTGQTKINLSNNTLTPAVNYYSQSLVVSNSANYTLFLGGASPNAIDPVLITENYKNYIDSICGVRFINMSPNSNPISVNIVGQANGSEVSGLAYKAYSIFKQYPAKSINKTYAFQIKDATTGNLITSYTLSTPYFHNVTIMLRGMVGKSPVAGATLITHP